MSFGIYVFTDDMDTEKIETFQIVPTNVLDCKFKLFYKNFEENPTRKIVFTLFDSTVKLNKDKSNY